MNQLSSRTIWAMIGVFLVVVSVAFGIFLLISSKVPAVASTKTQYDTSYIAAMKEAERTKNIYARTALLNQVTTSTDESTQYQPSDLGKTDITQIGK